MKISWTDRPDGRQFWTFDTQKDTWVKTSFVTWDQLKSPSTLLKADQRVKSSVV